MGEDIEVVAQGGSAPVMMGSRIDREHLEDLEDTVKSAPAGFRQQGSVRSWLSRKFMSGCVILFPIAITFYITWWFIEFVDGFFSPIYAHLGIHIFGLGFITSIVFIFMAGVFVSSWVGASILGVGEWFIKRMPLVRHIYSASKQISAAISPDEILHVTMDWGILGILKQTDMEDEELCSVYVPTNHLYIGDIFLVKSSDIIRPNLSVREGIEIVVSGGMTMPQVISPLVLSRGGALGHTTRT